LIVTAAPSNPANPLPYRLGVGIVVFDARGQVFVGRRIDQTREAWQMPQGGIDAGESPLDAALRELAEETSIVSVDILAETADWLYYDLPPELQGVSWGGRYRGQKQKWFAARFTGLESEINLATAHPEFNAWRWQPFATLIDHAVPFKRDLYRDIVTEFEHVAAKLAAGSRD
jgi:putative (di)nucleoside polyphosphate hydrolase